MITEEVLPGFLSHDEQFKAISDRLLSKKALIKTVIEAEDVEAAIEESAPRPIAAVIWTDEINPSPKRPMSIYPCPQDEYRDWVIIIVTEHVGGVVEGIKAKDEVISILENWRPCLKTSPFVKVRASFLANKKEYACSAYSLSFRTWYTNTGVKNYE